MLPKLKEFIYKDAGINICGHSYFDLCKIFEKGDHFEKTVTKKKYCIHFPLDCTVVA